LGWWYRRALTPTLCRTRSRRPRLRRAQGGAHRNDGWPGARRRVFLPVCLVFPYVWTFALSAVSPFLIRQFGRNLMGTMLPFAEYLPLLVLVYFGVKRLANLGMNRWWCLAAFVPILNVWVGFRCFACPAGYAHHRKLDGPGIALAILYWLMILAIVLILASLAAVFFGVIDSPELQQQLREALRTTGRPARRP